MNEGRKKGGKLYIRNEIQQKKKIHMYVVIGVYVRRKRRYRERRDCMNRYAHNT